MQNSALEKFQVERVAHFQYDFAKYGGTAGDIVLTDDVIPDDALITRGALQVKTALVGSGASVALKVNTAEDVLAATAITSMDGIGDLLVVVPVPQTASTWIKTAAKKNLTMTISAAALTAGKFEVFLAYFMGD